MEQPHIWCSREWMERLDPYLSQQCDPRGPSLRKPYNVPVSEAPSAGEIVRRFQEQKARERERELRINEKQYRRDQEYLKRRFGDNDEGWEEPRPDGTLLIGITEDRSHTHIGPNFVAIRAENQPKIHLHWQCRWNPNTCRYEYGDDE